jgi:hypothetical protein
MLKNWPTGVALGLVLSVLGLMAVTMGPSWLGDPRGISPRNPFVELLVYGAACLTLFLPPLAVLTKTKGAIGLAASIALICVMAAMPLLVLTTKNDLSYYQPLDGSPAASIQANETFAAWFFLLVGGWALFAGLMAAVSYLNGLPEKTGSAAAMVGKQTVLGDARFADDDEVHAALTGRAGPPTLPMFED